MMARKLRKQANLHRLATSVLIVHGERAFVSVWHEYLAASGCNLYELALESFAEVVPACGVAAECRPR